jgi:hypothetical protein
VVFSQFDNGQARAFPQYSAVEQAGKCGGARTVSPKANAKELMLVENCFCGLVYGGACRIDEFINR